MRKRDALKLEPGDYVWIKRKNRDPYERRQPVELKVEHVEECDSKVCVYVEERPGVAFQHIVLEVHRFHVVRFEYPNFVAPAKVIKWNVSLREAREHCKRDDTHSHRGNIPGPGDWFDGYTEFDRGLFE